MYLVSGTNQEGYLFALKQSWETLFGSFNNMPVKSALTKIRAKVSFTFFRDIFKKQITEFESLRRTFRGFHVYAIDGDKIYLPASKDILANRFRGFFSRDGLETHSPVLYLTHAYDVVSGVTKDLVYSPLLNEIKDAIKMVAGFESNSITLYDRLYFSRKLVHAHIKAGNYFICRCSLKTTFKEVENFSKSSSRVSEMVIADTKVYLYKVSNPKSKQPYIFATNLPPNTLKRKEMASLYLRRWEVETSFRESTVTAALEQWHSKTYNGIQQELYAHYWLINFARIQKAVNERPAADILNRQYQRANFKLIYQYVIQSLPELLKGLWRKVKTGIQQLIARSTEKRTRLKRKNPRRVRKTKKSYKNDSLIKRRHLK